MAKGVPINRMNKFFSMSDFNLEIEFGREYIESDINMRVVLFQVDKSLSSTDDIYNEASNGEIRYKTPVELSVIALIDKPENKTYNNNGSLRYLQDGKLIFGIYDSQLTEIGCDINFGDYIGYQVTETEMRYFTVSNDGAKNYDNAHTIFGYKGAFRTVSCVPVDDNEFTGF